MKVREYLKLHGLQKLQDEFKIVVVDYPDRITLNYHQIDSPRFNPICDECRGLILKKDTDWTVLSRAFDRFYNVGEGEMWKAFDVSLAQVQEKIDGSLISLYHDGNGWQIATRKMAFGEGMAFTGRTFATIFQQAVKNTSVFKYLQNHYSSMEYTWIFELTSPETRNVTPFSDYSVTLIGARNKTNGIELTRNALDNVAKDMQVKCPKQYSCKTIEEVQRLSEKLSAMEEGFVLVIEQNGSHQRLKCKNPAFVAIAHMREHGGVPTPKNILTLIMVNEQHEYLGYFPEDKKFFDFVEGKWNESVARIVKVWEETKSIENQKEFALTILGRCQKFESGVLFSVKKNRGDVSTELRKLGAKKIAKAMNLKEAFVKIFGVEVEDEDDAE